MRQFGLYLLWAREICGDPTLVREDRVGPTSGEPVVPPGAWPGSRVGDGEVLKASKHEANLKIRSPYRAVEDDDVDRLQV